MNERTTIFGTQVSVTNISETPKQIKSLAKSGSGYICLTDGYVIVLASKNKKLREILNNSLMTLPDGSPLAIYAKLKGLKKISSISGYWLVKKLMQTGLSHYFYGSSPSELKRIEENLTKEFPEAKILGYKSPPLISPDELENNKTILSDLKEINKLKPNLIWVGMNSPKQDYLMAYYSQYLDHSIMIGIGGVYDYLSGSMKISPEWVKKLSLRWVYRIVQNPKRIFKKAVIAIVGFSWLFLKELVTGKH
ncbi:MAG: WecB/TagA/CpsF family glycosyltransferase [Bacteroidales bacterium]|nr:WecB/TagA/CpsF family glycosyltransferase [Bacteroidales bacterium]